MPFVPEKQSPTCTVSGICGMSLWKAATRLPILCAHPCPLPVKSRLLVPTGSFVLGKAVIPLPDILHEGEWSLLMQQEITTQLSCSSRPEPSFSPGVEKPRSLRSFHYLQKTCLTQFPWFPSLWSDRFSCVNLCPTLSLFSPWGSVPFPPGRGNFSLPQFTSTYLGLVMLSHSNHGGPSSNLPIDFLDVPVIWPQYSYVRGTRKA